jgi:hypothetical protein
MTLSPAPCEETSRGSPGARVARANAFRVLQLPADAELKQIDRQQGRLLIAIELRGLQATGEFCLLPLCDLSKEEVLQAVHLLQRPEDRLIEELFWVHEMSGRGDLDTMLAGLYAAAGSNTTPGAVAGHNLAVIQTSLGQESPSSRRFAHWEEALQTWKKTIDDPLFWTFMGDRARGIECQKVDVAKLKAAVCRQLTSIFSEKLANAVKLRNLTAIPALVRIALEHRPWLKLDAALDSFGKQAIKDGTVSLGAILDRLSGIAQQDNKANIRESLQERERELQDVTGAYGPVVRSLGALAEAEGWDDAVASSYQKLSLGYFNLLDDPAEAIKLIAQARELGRDPRLLQSMERDWRHVQWAILTREADDLVRTGDFAKAEQKLTEAFAISTEEQQTQIKAMQARCRCAREAIERDKQQVHVATLCREAEALMRRGDFATAHYKLAVALTIATQQEKNDIKAMQERCRWALVLCGIDTTKKSPILFTLFGIGAAFHGNRDYDSGTKSFVTNHWLTIFFLPIIPLGAYRITDEYEIHGKAPLPKFLKMARWAIAASILVVAFTAVFTRRTITEAKATVPRHVVAPTGGPPPSVAPPQISAGTRDPPSEDVAEQTALSMLGQSLQDRKQELDVEAENMEKQKGYLARVASSYQGERVPNGGRSLYEALLADHNSRVNKYNRKVAAWQAEFAAYTSRKNALNGRKQP